MPNLQFVRQIVTYPGGRSLKPFEDQVNDILAQNHCRLVAVHPLPVQKIGGTEMQVVAVFEYAESQDTIGIRAALIDLVRRVDQGEMSDGTSLDTTATHAALDHFKKDVER